MVYFQTEPLQLNAATVLQGFNSESVLILSLLLCGIFSVQRCQVIQTESIHIIPSQFFYSYVILRGKQKEGEKKNK